MAPYRDILRRGPSTDVLHLCLCTGYVQSNRGAGALHALQSICQTRRTVVHDGYVVGVVDVGKMFAGDVESRGAIKGFTQNPVHRSAKQSGGQDAALPN